VSLPAIENLEKKNALQITAKWECFSWKNPWVIQQPTTKSGLLPTCRPCWLWLSVQLRGENASTVVGWSSCSYFSCDSWL